MTGVDAGQVGSGRRGRAPKRRGSRRRWGWLVLGVLLGVLGALVVRAVVLVRATPDYWESNRMFLDATPGEELESLAREVETRLPREWTYPIGTGDGVRKIRVYFDEANAWLALRMGAYLANQGVALPEAVGQVMLTQRDGALVLAFNYESSALGSRVASVFFGFERGADGTLGAGVVSARAGEQRLGVKQLVSAVADRARLEDPGAQEALVRLGRGERLPLPRFRVDDRRWAEVLAVEVQPQWVEVTLHVAFDDARPRE
ncbi:MAG: hypothetical protein AAGG38_09975 [Planctomycetota bacterium]